MRTPPAAHARRGVEVPARLPVRTPLPPHAQMQLLASRNTPGVPGRYEWVQEAFEQVMLCKHEGRPHWGKNW